MTIGKVLKRIEENKPSSFPREQLVEWLQRLDMEIWQKVILTHEGWEKVERPQYDETTDEDTELIVAEPYDSIYEHWLQSRIDYMLEEFGKFNNSNAAFEADRTEFTNWYNRTHMPLQLGGRYF